METGSTSSLASGDHGTAATAKGVVLQSTAHAYGNAQFLLAHGNRKTYTVWVDVGTVSDVFRAANGVMRHWGLSELKITDYRVVPANGDCEVIASVRQGEQTIAAKAKALSAGIAAMDVWLRLYNRTFFDAPE